MASAGYQLLEREREDKQAWQREEEKCHNKSGGPALSLEEHEQPIGTLIAKAAPGRVSQALVLTSLPAPESQKDWGKARGLNPFNSSDDELLSDKEKELKSKVRKRDHGSPDLIILDDDDDPLEDCKQKTPTKKPREYSAEEVEALERLLLQLKSEGQAMQYSKETAGLTKYRHEHVPDLCKALNTDDHSAYLTMVKEESWSYPAKGNLETVKQYHQELAACRDEEKIAKADKTLWDKGMAGIPQENTAKGAKRERIKAHYVMRVLHGIEGEIIDNTHPDYSQEQNIGLHDIISPASMNQIEKNGQITVWSKTLSGKVDYGYCPLCPYASQNHWTLNNHVQLHFCVTMVCGMADCWFVSHNADDMWKHSTSHRLATAEPVAVRTKKK